MSNPSNGLTIAGIILILLATAIAAFTSPRDPSTLAATTNGAILGLAMVIASRR